MKEISLYFHIPFCKSKCYYCDFVSYTNKQEKLEEYFNSVISEIELYDFLEGSNIKSIFFGGGTPSIVDTEYIHKILEKCKLKFNFNKDIEITLESNPDSLTDSKLFEYKQMGINRLSIGLQAWQNHLLEGIGRVHLKDEFTEAFNYARENGFNNINVDLIFSLPNQTLKDWEETLINVVELKPEHLSCYALKFETGTKLHKLLKAGFINAIDDETDRKMYYLAKDILSQNGYKQYEVSNFSKPEFECRHNITYWTYGEYIGFGAASHSFFDGKRTENISQIEKYIKAINKNKFAYKSEQVLSNDEQISEYIITGLRLTEGINKKTFYDRFGVSINDIFSENISKFARMGLLIDEWDHIKLTSKGFDLSNLVLMEFV